MYAVDERDTVIELHDVPPPDTGAPLPVVLSNEDKLLLAYIVSEPDSNWDGVHPISISAESQNLLIALVRFNFACAHMFGPPNDEAFTGHPLAKRGLAPYRVFEVKQSSWIRRLERMNSVHPMHDRERFLESRKHFIFAFHDSTFECIAKGFEVQVNRGSLQGALEEMVESLKNRA